MDVTYWTLVSAVVVGYCIAKIGASLLTIIGMLLKFAADRLWAHLTRRT